MRQIVKQADMIDIESNLNNSDRVKKNRQRAQKQLKKKPNKGREQSGDLKGNLKAKTPRQMAERE